MTLLLHQITILALPLLTVLSSCIFICRRKFPTLETLATFLKGVEVAEKSFSFENFIGRKDSESAYWADMSQRSQSKTWFRRWFSRTCSMIATQWGLLNMVWMIFMTMINDRHDHNDIYLHNSSNNLALKATLYLLSLGTKMK